MTNLYKRMSGVQSTNPFFSKDLKKSLNATKFIGQGSIASSTHKYMLAAGNLANCGEYTSDDVVFVSAEGMRRGRLDVDFEELKLAIDAQATFITDDKYNRERPYNQGERQVAAFFTKHGYIEVKPGMWQKQ